MLRLSRAFSTSLRRANHQFGSLGPMSAPPRLPKEQQEEFERLQKAASTSSAFADLMTDEDKAALDADIGPTLASKGPELVHPEQRRRYDEFEGDVNPKTGEIGGPKQDPLKHGDYSFNGRCTDF